VAFAHRLRVRFHQADPAGVLFFGRVFELVQATYEDMCRAAGIDIEGFMHQRIYTTPIVRVEADYHQPIRVGEEVIVEAAVARLGSSSIHMRYTIAGDDGQVRVKARVVHVFVDADTWQAVAIPDDVRSAYRRFGSPGAGLG
jgi:YbgC/YbaW family acyl-CoA thioester hydrolase